jgi:hypothetical protein
MTGVSGSGLSAAATDDYKVIYIYRERERERYTDLILLSLSRKDELYTSALPLTQSSFNRHETTLFLHQIFFFFGEFYKKHLQRTKQIYIYIISHFLDFKDRTDRDSNSPL